VLGLTQVISSKDIGQITFTHTNGHGYYSDPYKFANIWLSDIRPREKRQSTMLARWNHYFEGPDATLRLNYRYYTDTWGVRAHTLGAEYVLPLSNGWTLTPLLRLHDQSAADFYVDQADFPNGAPIHSQDQRLSAFGARSLGVKISKEFDPNWTVDLRYEYYEQRGSWRMLGEGSPDLAPFRAKIIQFGLARKF
jgi:hypothetical protein